MQDVMPFFFTRLKAHIDRINEVEKPKEKWTMNLIARRADIPSGHPSQWKKPLGDKSRRSPSDTEIEKIAGLTELGLDVTTLKSWRAMDEYPPEAIQLACKYLEMSGGNLGVADNILKEETKERSK
jgi:hypothetical protein